MSHEAQCSCAVLYADDDYTTTGETCPQVTAIVLCLESTTVNPYHYGQTVVDRFGRRGNAEIEAVLTHHVGGESLSCRLWWPFGKVVCLKHTFPCLGGLRCFPAKVAYRWRSVWYCFIDGQILSVGSTFHVTGFYMCSHQGLPLCGHRKGETAEHDNFLHTCY